MNNVYTYIGNIHIAKVLCYYLLLFYSTGGCAMFVHSCYGAHGKRSFQMSMQQPARDWPATRREEETQIDDAINKYFKIKPSSPHFNPFWQKIVSFRTYIMGTYMDFLK